MTGQTSQWLNGSRALGSKRLHNGGVVYEFNRPETAIQLHKERTAFMASFGRTSVVKEKAVVVSKEYVPTVHNPDALSDNRKIEHNSKIKEDTLLTTTWIKPVQRKVPG